MSSIATYRGYTHTANEINLVSVEYRTQYSPRRRKLTETRTMRIMGELIYSDTASIVNKVNEVVSAYSQDGGDFTYTVGGVLAHSLTNTANCISGVKVISKQFPSGGPEQLATTRTFAATLQATYDVSEDNIVSWRESVQVTGTGGPLYAITDTLLGPIVDVLAPATAYYYRQSGTAVGFKDYPVPPGPLAAQWEFGHRRTITNTTGVQQGTGIRYYTTSWAYYMTTPPGTTIGNSGTSI